eukprot:1483559-Prymnesium_polylepis.2
MPRSRGDLLRRRHGSSPVLARTAVLRARIRTALARRMHRIARGRVGAITTAAERDVLAPQIAARPHTSGVSLVDRGEVLPTLGALGVIGDGPQDDREARLVVRLVGVDRHGVFAACALHL